MLIFALAISCVWPLPIYLDAWTWHSRFHLSNEIKCQRCSITLWMLCNMHLCILCNMYYMHIYVLCVFLAFAVGAPMILFEVNACIVMLCAVLLITDRDWLPLPPLILSRKFLGVLCVSQVSSHHLVGVIQVFALQVPWDRCGTLQRQRLSLYILLAVTLLLSPWCHCCLSPLELVILTLCMMGSFPAVSHRRETWVPKTQSFRPITQEFQGCGCWVIGGCTQI